MILYNTMRLGSKLHYVSLLCLCALITVCCTSSSNDRNRIVFKDSIDEVQDSLRLINTLLNKANEAEVKNVFFDGNNFIYVNNVKVAPMSVGDKIDFLGKVAQITGLSLSESFKLVSLARFLRDNYVSGCFKHRLFGIYFFNYRRTFENVFEDQRYILVFDQNTRRTKGSFIESYQLIDRKGDLVLLAPAGVKLK